MAPSNMTTSLELRNMLFYVAKGNLQMLINFVEIKIDYLGLSSWVQYNNTNPLKAANILRLGSGWEVREIQI